MNYCRNRGERFEDNNSAYKIKATFRLSITFKYIVEIKLVFRNCFIYI